MGAIRLSVGYRIQNQLWKRLAELRRDTGDRAWVALDTTAVGRPMRI